jgi:hypothetical protein
MTPDGLIQSENNNKNILDAQAEVLRAPWHQQNGQLHQDEHWFILNFN